jgi:hypothetical protein
LLLLPHLLKSLSLSKYASPQPAEACRSKLAPSAEPFQLFEAVLVEFLVVVARIDKVHCYMGSMDVKE